MENMGVHGNCSIVYAVLRKTEGQKEIDIKGLISGISISESLYNANITISANIIDTIGFLESFPLLGEEILSISLQDPMMSIPINLECFVFSIDGIVVLPNNSGVGYVLHMTTRTSFQSKIRRVLTSFNKPASMIVKDIFSQTYEKIEITEDGTKTKSIRMEGGNGDSKYELFTLPDDRTLTVEDTESIVKCIIPNLSPDEAMSFISARSISHEGSPSCSFKFFETKSGYFFVTDEFLIRQAINGDNGNTTKKLIYNPMPDINPSNLSVQINKVKKFNVLNYINTLTDLYSGAYNSNIMEIDILYGKVENVRFDHEMSKKLFTGMTGTKRFAGTERHTDAFIKKYFNEENEKLMVFSKDYDTYADVQIKGNQYLPEISLRRMAYSYRMASTTVSVVIDGRLDISVGDVIEFDVPEFTSAESREKNDKFSGNYLVTDVNHTIDGMKLDTEFIMTRYGWGV